MKTTYVVAYHDIYTGKDEVIAEFDKKVDAIIYIEKASRINDSCIYYLTEY